jgi:hypothetical protein
MAESSGMGKEKQLPGAVIRGIIDISRGADFTWTLPVLRQTNGGRQAADLGSKHSGSGIRKTGVYRCGRQYVK